MVFNIEEIDFGYTSVKLIITNRGQHRLGRFFFLLFIRSYGQGSTELSNTFVQSYEIYEHSDIQNLILSLADAVPPIQLWLVLHVYSSRPFIKYLGWG